MNRNIKILIVVGRYPSASSPFVNIFVKEQIDSLIENYHDLEIEVFNIHTEISKLNYLKRRAEFKKFANDNKFEIVHYHYGLTALIGLYQNIKAKQVITFHGSDLNLIRAHKAVSRLAVKQFDYTIVVSPSLLDEITFQKYSVITCGVNTGIFKPMDKIECRKRLGLSMTKKLILFPADKTNPVKNYKFLERVFQHLNRDLFEIVELKNVLRKDVPLYMNAVDVITLTSIKEGSPLVIKEAAYCHTPIVTVDVVDVKYIIEGSNNSYVVERNEKLFAMKILEAIEKEENTGFKNLAEFDNKVIASKIHNLYHSLVNS